MEESIALLDLHSTLKVLHTIADIPPNTNGLLALSPNSDNPYLAYPGSTISGEIHIFDTTRLVSRNNLKWYECDLIFVESRTNDTCT